MKNTKLIKKLKSVGFVAGEFMPNSHLELQIEEYNGFVRYAHNTNALLFFINNVFTDIRVATTDFIQIVSKIKEVTGVDINPKPTKNKRIADLAKLTHTLTKEIVALGEEQDDVDERLTKLETVQQQFNQQPERVRILKVKAVGAEWEIGEIAKVVIRSGNILLLQKENYDRKDWFNIDEVTEQLHTDPVENSILEFGSSAVIVWEKEGEFPLDGFDAGDVVRVGFHIVAKGVVVCDNGIQSCIINRRYLKPYYL